MLIRKHKNKIIIIGILSSLCLSIWCPQTLASKMVNVSNEFIDSVSDNKSKNSSQNVIKVLKETKDLQKINIISNGIIPTLLTDNPSFVNEPIFLRNSIIISGPKDKKLST